METNIEILLRQKQQAINVVAGKYFFAFKKKSVASENSSTLGTSSTSRDLWQPTRVGCTN